MTESELHEKALTFPMAPGVYFYRDSVGNIIYIGKAKVLKNRVSQYFHSSRPAKAEIMIKHAASLEYTVTADEFEALVLESTLIKQYKPRYNILLKDDKGYPFIRADIQEEYPKLTVVNKKAKDGAKYFGPYGGRGTAFGLISAINTALNLPVCSLVFPRDVGRSRPCLHYQTGTCYGPCRKNEPPEKYRELFGRALMILDNRYEELAAELKKEMEEAAEHLDFEKAASLRDHMKAVQAMSEKQIVLNDQKEDTDAFGWHCGDICSAFSVIGLHKGSIYRTRTESFHLSPREFIAEIPELIKQYYSMNPELIPDKILITAEIDDLDLIERFFTTLKGKKVSILPSCRSTNRKLLLMAEENAKQEIIRISDPDVIKSKTCEMLGKLIGLKNTPIKIDSFDISNTAGADNVGAAIRFTNGKPDKNSYRLFAIRSVSGQDDFHSMSECVERRYSKIPPEEMPDLILADGGIGQIHACLDSLEKISVSVPVMGLVKDEKHRTRALTDADGNEISLNANPQVFRLLSEIQEEVHRFVLAYHKKKRSASLTHSVLEKIPGIGEERRKLLLKTFGSVKKISSLSVGELKKVLPEKVAQNVFDYFQNKRDF